MVLVLSPTRLPIKVRMLSVPQHSIPNAPYLAAAAAMNSMNGVTLGNKQLVVRLHEPKQLRQEKLAQRFGGHNGHPRSSSGATSPTASEAGESYAGWPSPSSHPAVLGSPIMSHHERPDRARRSSGSFYHVGSPHIHVDHLLNNRVRPHSLALSTCQCATMIFLRCRRSSARRCSQES